MKRILITGIAGMLGQNLSREYLEKGWEVWGVDDLSVGKYDWLPGDVAFKNADVCSYYFGRSESECFPNFDLIIHLASRKIPRDGNSFITLHENTIGVTNILSLAVKTKTKLIFLSTSDVYGKNKVWKEDADLHIGPPDIARWSYAISKIWGEQLLYSTPYEFDFGIVRLFGTYGPWTNLKESPGPFKFIHQAFEKEALTIHGDGLQKRAFQYVDDAVDGIIRVAETDLKRVVFNIGNPAESVTINHLSHVIWEMINPSTMRQAKHIPHSADKYEEVSERIPDISKARDLLGFEPKTSLDEGLRRTIEWQKTAINLIKEEKP